MRIEKRITELTLMSRIFCAAIRAVSEDDTDGTLK
jgi:hypothetical protein